MVHFRICSLLVIQLVVFQVSQTYNITDITFASNILILTSFETEHSDAFLNKLAPHTGAKNTLFCALLKILNVEIKKRKDVFM